MHRARIAVFIVALIFGFVPFNSVFAQIPKIEEVPKILPLKNYEEFSKEKAALLDLKTSLTAKAQRHNEKCGSVPAGTPLADECVKEQAELEQERQNYVEAVNDFNKRVAQAKSAHAFAGIDSQGEFYILMKDGRKLSAADTSECPLDNGTKIVTGKDGKVTLKLPDETTFTMGPESEFTIDDFVYDPTTTASKIAANIIKGVFRFVTGKVARTHPENLKVELAAGEIGPRGTDFEVSVDSSGDGYVKLFSGKLEITGKKTGNKFSLDAGQMMKFDADGTWGQPTSLDAAQPSI
jgi:hypothetical protein